MRIYVDTSVFGGVSDEEFAEASQRFFGIVRARKHVVLVSPETARELEDAPDVVRAVLGQIPPDCLEAVPVGTEVEALARAYVEAGVVGPASESDAVHVAAATVARADLIVRWNFRHIVNYDRIRKYNGVNAPEGYGTIAIHSPMEVSDGDENEDV